LFPATASEACESACVESLSGRFSFLGDRGWGSGPALKQRLYPRLGNKHRSGDPACLRVTDAFAVRGREAPLCQPLGCLAPAKKKGWPKQKKRENCQGQPWKTACERYFFGEQAIYY